MDQFIPLDRMAGFRMVNKRAERSLKNLNADGSLKSIATIFGRYYRVSVSTGQLLQSIARGEMSADHHTGLPASAGSTCR